MRITLDQLKCMLADSYNVSYKDVHFIEGVHEIEIKGPLENMYTPAEIKTGQEIYKEIEKEHKKMLQLEQGLNGVQSKGTMHEAYKVLDSALAEQVKKVRDLKLREYKY